MNAVTLAVVLGMAALAAACVLVGCPFAGLTVACSATATAWMIDSDEEDELDIDGE